MIAAGLGYSAGVPAAAATSLIGLVAFWATSRGKAQAGLPWNGE